MTRRRDNIFHASPVEAASLRDLLQYYFQSGVGLPVSEEGVAGQWTDVRLQEALAGIGIHADKRSIQSWLSGATIPKSDKLKGLARLAAEDPYLQEKWSTAFIRLRFKAIEARKQARKASAGTGSLSETDVPVPDTPQAEPHTVPRKVPFHLVVASVVLSMAIMASLLLALSFAWNAAPIATNMEFCSEEEFSTETLECTIARTSFPEGLETLMVTFDLPNVPEGETFTRKWYLNGSLIHEKTSFKDDAWPGYTFWHWPEGFDSGEYALQIVSGDKAVTQTFQVGPAETEYLYR